MHTYKCTYIHVNAASVRFSDVAEDVAAEQRRCPPPMHMHMWCAGASPPSYMHVWCAMHMHMCCAMYTAHACVVHAHVDRMHMCSANV